MSRVIYRGRFAPTPSGPLHLGSLFTALASYLHARHQNGVWLLRIDDLDRARCPPGAAAAILRQLEAHGLTWDESVRYQTGHLRAYQDALAQLDREDVTYTCVCTRQQLRKAGLIYPGTCRVADAQGRGSRRLRVADETLCFDDAWQGRQCRALSAEVGDFVLRRADRVIGYQLACAVDERAQRITEVVRGADLLDSTFMQLHVLRRLGEPAPAYRHLPVLNDAAERKLSKQNHAPPVAAADASANLFRCMELLGQVPPPQLRGAAPKDLLHWAIRHWDAAKVPRSAAIPAGAAL